ncbi:MAG TPA: TetR/AcrR family transcriptional regulator [Phenylobacterium sp.]|nr:TetR/AcrR family transcriptional regulator [Phenylobacterium sp.]
MQTPPETATLRDRIIEAADRLFYRQGIRSVGVDRIAAELGISKKTLYRCFASKDELVLAYLEGRFRPLPSNSERPPAQQILDNLDRLAHSLATSRADRGCAFVNALAELAEEDVEARALAARYKDSRRLWYRDLLAQLDVDDPDTLATQLALLVDGAYSSVLVQKHAGMAQAAIAAARILLKNAGVAIDAAGAQKPRSGDGSRDPGARVGSPA